MSRARLLSAASPVVLLLALAAGACATRQPPLDVSTPADQEVRVTLRDNFTITASPATVRVGRVKVIVTNEGTMSHGLGIEGQSVEQFVTPGTSLTRETLMTPRTWVLYCPVADHRDRGMKADLLVQ